EQIMIDVTEQISAVRREVGGRMLEAGQARVITVSRSYPAELTDVWDACTSPERIPRWFLPVSGELKEGGRYQLGGNAGGTITRCDPPYGFDATWEMAATSAGSSYGWPTRATAGPCSGWITSHMWTTSGGRSSAPARSGWAGTAA
ncbi:MAG: SRPBCC domain-containing protein, partial [Streptosporangiaceae bacterium]